MTCHCLFLIHSSGNSEQNVSTTLKVETRKFLDRKCAKSLLLSCLVFLPNAFIHFAFFVSDFSTDRIADLKTKTLK